MKVLYQTYTFTPSTRKVTFNSSDVISLENILLITNVTNNTIIYNFANTTQGGTLNGNVLTLTYNTTSMSSSDKLQIWLDLYGTPALDTTSQYINNQTALLKRVVKLLEPIGTQDTNQRQRISAEQATAANLNATVTIAASQTLATVTTVSTVSSVTNIAGYGGVDPRYQFIDTARIAYATGIRQKLINT